MSILLPGMSDKWPHQFTKNGKGYEISEGKYAQTYICVHCYQEYVQGFEEPKWVKEPCPARDTKREVKRIFKYG